MPSSALREDSAATPVLPADDSLAALLERAESSGLPITVVGSLPPLPPPAARAAYRVVQESLTNAAKHAPGMSVQVDLGGDPGTGDAVVTVVNPVAERGRSPDEHSGLGLVSLDERVRTAGGQLVVRRTDRDLRSDRPATAGRTPGDGRRDQLRSGSSSQVENSAISLR
jgi:signal transduction histidine kinase